MSFNLYFAGDCYKEPDEYIMQIGGNRLYTQLYERKLGERWMEAIKSGKTDSYLFADSTAYSAWSRGVDVDIDNYIDYANENINELHLLTSLDKIPGVKGTPPTVEEYKQAPQKSWENYLYMRERILDKDKLLPVFHLGEDFKHLHEMLEFTEDGKHIPYIGLGGTVGASMTVKDNWFSQVFKVIQQSNNPNVHTHAFGLTSFKLLEKYPFFSSDSTSWIMVGANGNIFTPWGTYAITEHGVHRGSHYNYLSKQQQDDIRAWVTGLGFDLDKAMERPEERAMINITFLKSCADNYVYRGTNKFQKRLF